MFSVCVAGAIVDCFLLPLSLFFLPIICLSCLFCFLSHSQSFMFVFPSILLLILLSFSCMGNSCIVCGHSLFSPLPLSLLLSCCVSVCGSHKLLRHSNYLAAAAAT